jgi:hypothetical protein
MMINDEAILFFKEKKLCEIETVFYVKRNKTARCCIKDLLFARLLA